MGINLPFLKKKERNSDPKTENSAGTETKNSENPNESKVAAAASSFVMKKKMENIENESTAERKLAKGIPSVQDIIAPSAIEVDFNYLKIGDKYFRTLFVSGYPRFVGANWLEPIINFDRSINITMFYYPINARNVLDDLRRKIAEMEATINIAREKGRVIDPAVQAALGDAKSLQEQLVKGIERFFHFSFYVTISADTIDELNSVTYQVESTLGSLSLISKKATLEMEQAFQTSIPVCLDKLQVIRNMDTTSVATTFPFTSSELTANEGILYGVNQHNGSLVIFDRFSLENANSVIFAKSGAGKSYLVKLEALRYLLFGVDVIVIDPETEYRRLCEAVGGEYIDFNMKSKAKINPFELPETAEQEDQLSLKILSLHALLRIMLGDMSPSESAILDRALVDTYRLKGITQDPTTQNREPPLLEDLYKVLLAMDEPESKSLAERMERYLKGSLAGIFDQRSNVDLDNSFSVFSIRNLEDVLRPIAMFMILDFIWTKIKHDMKKRLLILDEAWTLMRYPDSAAFVYSLAKRARKYYLGLTTVTQDVADFLNTDYGKAVVTNSSIQILLKQHPAAIDRIAEVFYLSEGEKNLLLSAGIGEGLFFAGANHVAIQVRASAQEHRLITTNPEELLKMKRESEIDPEILKSAQRTGTSGGMQATAPTMTETEYQTPTSNAEIQTEAPEIQPDVSMDQTEILESPIGAPQIQPEAPASETVAQKWSSAAQTQTAPMAPKRPAPQLQNLKQYQNQNRTQTPPRPSPEQTQPDPHSPEPIKDQDPSIPPKPVQSQTIPPQRPVMPNPYSTGLDEQGDFTKGTINLNQ
ncbi:hypothetical protein A2982_03460 [candidate division WWE3 bacterium RIFCSPLOWO2_01_FULL_39_13]|uniref:TraG P-loop domain-containing protein n=1 Tax=candidate division WWE3 bacterium RIFCSPLOWO2_01_FULL_39_13 TaxID=1802624 RepID=A0A1F4V3E4_UNCKA|nr:MAG: hypothetical protein A2982_03460 [candidate division WWE3 bacterium RIFCSPLOWO2_01_FULL_39_13]